MLHGTRVFTCCLGTLEFEGKLSADVICIPSMIRDQLSV